MSKESDVSDKRSSKNLLRFLNDPENFSGSASGVKPLNWIKRLQRLKELAELTDKEMLLIASDHLTGKAENWYEVVASKKCSTWLEFVGAFKMKYCEDQDDRWWRELNSLRQLSDETVEDVDVRLRELCALLEIDDDRTMVRAFLDAINEDIAYEVERENIKNGKRLLKSYDIVVSAATKLERVKTKYHRQIGGSSVVNPSVATPSVVAPSAGSESGTINDLLNEFRQLKISMLNAAERNGPSAVTGNQANVLNTSVPVRQIVCYDCGEPGHKRYQCPRRNASSTTATAGSSSVATGANAVPIGSKDVSATSSSGKAMEHRL